MESKEEFESRIKVPNINQYDTYPNSKENQDILKTEIMSDYMKEKEKKQSIRNQKQSYKYTSKKESLREAQEKRKKGIRKGIKKRIIAIIVAGTLTLGGASYAVSNYNNSQDNVTVTSVLKDGKQFSDLGLDSSTVGLMEEYDQIFEDFENGDYDYSDMSVSTIEEMSSDIESLYFSVIKEKMSSLTGIDKSDFTLRYSFEKGDGSTYVTIIAYEGEYNEEYWHNNNLLSAKKTNTLPTKLANVIPQLEEFDNLNSDLNEDMTDGKVSYKKYLKKLQKYYGDIEEIATSEFIMDENGNITLEQYEKEQTQTNQRSNDEEEER